MNDISLEKDIKIDMNDKLNEVDEEIRIGVKDLISPVKYDVLGKDEDENDKSYKLCEIIRENLGIILIVILLWTVLIKR